MKSFRKTFKTREVANSIIIVNCLDTDRDRCIRESGFRTRRNAQLIKPIFNNRFTETIEETALTKSDTVFK